MGPRPPALAASLIRGPGARGSWRGLGQSPICRTKKNALININRLILINFQFEGVTGMQVQPLACGQRNTNRAWAGVELANPDG